MVSLSALRGLPRSRSCRVSVPASHLHRPGRSIWQGQPQRLSSTSQRQDNDQAAGLGARPGRKERVCSGLQGQASW